MAFIHHKVAISLLLTLGLLVSGCSNSPPRNADSICSIFREKDDWYDHARQSEQKWGMPIAMQMAILRHESRFAADALPPRKYLFGFIPWGRISSAYGYTQALDGTWEWYRKKTGNSWAERTDFADAVDFVAWYGHLTQKQLGIAPTDAHNHYLAYHEGHTGYKNEKHKAKPAIIAVARKVQKTYENFDLELTGCRDELETGEWWLLLKSFFTADS